MLRVYHWQKVHEQGCQSPSFRNLEIGKMHALVWSFRKRSYQIARSSSY